MEYILTIVESIVIIILIVVIFFFYSAYQKYRKLKIILNSITSSDDMSVLFGQVMEIIKVIISNKLMRSAILIPKEEEITVPYFENYTEKEIETRFTTKNRQLIYQSIFNAKAVGKNVFGSNHSPFSLNDTVDLESMSEIFNKEKIAFYYRYMLIPVYDREIAGLILFESYYDNLFNRRDTKKVQKEIEFLNYALSKIFLLNKLSLQSNTDPLTGLLNKRQFQLILDKHFELSKRQGTPFILGIIDIDHFKSINDEYGHAVGDQILKDVAWILEKNTRKSDYVFRIGGDEFCIILFGFDFVSREDEYICRLKNKIDEYNQAQKPTVIRQPISISIGFAHDRQAQTWQEIFEKADKRMYEDKTGKRALVCEEVAMSNE